MADHQHKFSLGSIFLISMAMLLSACSSSKVLTSYSTSKSPNIDGNLSDWNYKEALINDSEAFDYYTSTNDDYFNVFVKFNHGFYNRAVANSGYTIYLSNNPKNKHKLGITYPVGAFNALTEMPGTYSKLQDDPKWMNKPENQKLLKRLRKENYSRVMITQQQNPKETPQKVIVNVQQLRAQGIKIAADTSKRFITLEMQIPLQSSKTQQLALDAKDGQKIQLGFEINPPKFDLSDEVSEQADQQRRQRQTYGYGQYGSGRSSTSSIAAEQRLAQRMGQYSKWFTVEIKKPGGN